MNLPISTDITRPASKQEVRGDRLSKTLMDLDFFQDSKVVDIEETFGDAAPSYYQLIAFRILAEGGPIRCSSAVAILKRKKIGEQASSFIDYCVEIGLFYRKGDMLSSARADLEIHGLTEKRKQWRKLNKRRASRKLPDSNSQSTQSNSHVTEQEKEQEQEEEKEPEKETKSIRPDPDSGTKVLMTDREWQILTTKLGTECAIYWCFKLNDYATDNPAKFRKYKSHYRVVLQWHEMQLSRGKLWYEHPDQGKQYFPSWQVEKWRGS